MIPGIKLINRLICGCAFVTLLFLAPGWTSLVAEPLIPLSGVPNELRISNGSKKGKSDSGAGVRNQGISDVMWRSALLPGWGQLRQNRKVAGKRFMIGFIAAAGTNLILLYDYRLKKKEHDYARERLLVESPAFSATPSLPVFLRNFQDAGRTRNRLETSSRNVNFAFTALLGLYGWNLVDAWWFHKQSMVGLNFELGSKEVRFSLGMRF